MFFVILTYGLIGMEIYANKFDETTAPGQLHSYNDPLKSSITVFNVMTNDDWYGLLVLGSEIDTSTTIIYIFTMIYLLNYII